MKLLVAGSPSSIHTARFTALLREMGHAVVLFQSEIEYQVDELLRDVTLYVARPRRGSANGNKLKPWPTQGLFSIFSKQSLLHKDAAVVALQRLVKKIQPDGVISLKMQNDGYTVAGARERMPDFPPWLHFNWGTDIEYFAKDIALRNEHLPKVKKVLQLCDFYVADCMRDMKQAPEFGLRGKRLGVFLANGGFDLSRSEELRSGVAGKRDLVLVKAREWPPVSQGLKLLKVLTSIQSEFRGLKVMFMMGDEIVNRGVREAAATYGAPFYVAPTLSYDDLLKQYARARFTIAATTVDGTPSFLIESMLMGALPVHSSMASIREWVTDGENGLLYSLHDDDSMISAIRRAIYDSELIQTARVKNWEIAADRMNRDVIRSEFGEVLLRAFSDRESTISGRA